MFEIYCLRIFIIKLKRHCKILKITDFNQFETSDTFYNSSGQWLKKRDAKKINSNTFTRTN